jgi:hypothetical protein
MKQKHGEFAVQSMWNAVSQPLLDCMSNEKQTPKEEEERVSEGGSERGSEMQSQRRKKEKKKKPKLVFAVSASWRNVQDPGPMEVGGT